MAEGSVPLLSIQADWESVFNNVGEEIWISAKIRNKPSVHGKIKRLEAKVKGTSDLGNFETTEDFKLERIVGNSILIVNYQDTKTLFLAPNQTLSNIHHKEAVAIHTCEQSENKVVSASGNVFKHWDSKASGQILLEYSGHSSDVNKVYYFPSGVVTVSCSLDMQIKIVCAETGNNPRTLIGHSRSVTDVAIVSKGKNIISVSKDCRALLWNIGGNKVIAELIKTQSPIFCCDLISTRLILPEVEDISPGEVDTNDKMLIIGCEGGDVYIIAVQSRKVLSHLQRKNIISVSKDCRALLWNIGENKVIAELIKTQSPIFCCDLISTSLILPEVEDSSPGEVDTNDKMLLIGCEGGDVYIIAVQSRKVLSHLQVDADVKSAKFINDKQFLLGLSNGKVIHYELKQANNENVEVSTMKSWHYTESCVQCILPCTEYGFFTGYHDGHCVFQFYNHNYQIHLTGSLFDPIYGLTYDGAYIYTACRDGRIRKYLFEKLLIEKAFFAQ
ncbi:proteasomal ATPase-associated factor 1-like [Diaphorina citri]|uniref:Proteasomal ATPase-associated factor 1-like n=1 Tax=Diaphorina citri TaxID=121845 RepID=A0A3Q0IME1_DIACI|nr:proteasomal ATPase-associated factor 1-like [Diaphorina citri]